VEPLLGTTIRGAGHSPLDVGKNEIATGSYLSNFLFDVVTLGFPRTLGFPVGRDISEWPALEEKDKGQMTLPTEADHRRKYKDDQRKPFKGPDWPPPGGGGGGPGGPGGPSGGGFYDPFKSVEHQLGGIDLSAKAEFLGDLSSITGAVYDPEAQSLSLVGDEDMSLPPLDIQDLAVALACVYSPMGQDPQFSLDPADPKDPEGEWLKAVYVPEDIIAGTAFGEALFEADWLLKEYSFGISLDSSGYVSKRVSSVPGFKSLADLYFEKPDTSDRAGTWVRFWIVPDSMVIKRRGNSIIFDKCKMRVKAMKMVVTPEGLKDVPTDEVPEATAFAELFTQLYDEIAKESPEFARVKELAKVVALAKWMKGENVPVDLGWAWEYATQTGDRMATASAKALSLTWERRGEELYSGEALLWRESPMVGLRIFGGVDLTHSSEYIPDDGTAQHLQQEVQSALENESSGPVFAVAQQRVPKRVVVLPVTKSGQEMWRNSPAVVQNGIAYQYDPHTELITSACDAEANLSEFIYDAENELKTVKISSAEGWRIFGEKKDDGTEWSTLSPKGDTIVQRYDTTGYLREMVVNDEEWLSCDYEPDRGRATIRYKDYSEELSFDPDGQVEAYELRRITEDGGLSEEAEKIFFTYDDAKNTARIHGTEVAQIEIYYAGGAGTPLDSVRTPQGPTQFSYDSLQHVENITLPEGTCLTFSYEEENLKKMEVNDPEGRKAEYLFGEDGILLSRDFLGGVSEYGYHNGLLSSVRLAQGGEARYVYDDLNRLQEIHFPDGGWIEYRYQGHLLDVITHPTPGSDFETGR
jgi:YD repeat-containing protein